MAETYQVQALCQICGRIQHFRLTRPSRFPGNGHWTKCLTCEAWRYFFLVTERAVTMDALSSRDPVDDETAAAALADFFRAVYELDGPVELLRMFASFYWECHKEFPGPPADFADDTPDGNLKVDPEAKTKKATNGTT